MTRSIAMARYSPALLAALRQRYEQTDQPMNALAADFGIGITTLQTLVRKNGWTQRSNRMRDCPSALRLLEEAETLAASLPERETPAPQATPTPTLPLAGGGSHTVLDAATLPQPPDPALSDAGPTNTPGLSPVERLEALVVKELEAEEAARAELATRPRARHEAERCARTLSVLTQTLKTLQGMHTNGGTGGYAYDDMPQDMDAFRNNLARRIEAFMESRLGPERMALDRQMSALTDDELKELAQVGRERGMEALLRPAVEEEEASE
jgi:hypothetical protein